MSKSKKSDDMCPFWDSNDIFDIENYKRCCNCPVNWKRLHHLEDCRLHNIKSFADWKLEVLHVTWLGVGE